MVFLICWSIFTSSLVWTWVTIELLIFWAVSAAYKQHERTERLIYIFLFKSVAGVIILVGSHLSSSLLVLGVLVSLGRFPVHTWIVKGFTGWVPINIALFSLILKIIPIFFVLVVPWALVLAVATRVVGRIIMLRSSSFSELLILSGINQLGFLYNFWAVGSPLFYLLIYYTTVLLLVYVPSFGPWWIAAALPPSPLFFFKLTVLCALPWYWAVVLFLTVLVSYITYIKWMWGSLTYYQRYLNF